MPDGISQISFCGWDEFHGTIEIFLRIIFTCTMQLFRLVNRHVMVQLLEIITENVGIERCATATNKGLTKATAHVKETWGLKYRV